MVHNYQHKSNQSKWYKKKCQNLFLKCNKNLSAHMTSKQYCITRTTLTRHLRNKVSNRRQSKLGNFAPTFSLVIENKLVP